MELLKGRDGQLLMESCRKQEIPKLDETLTNEALQRVVEHIRKEMEKPAEEKASVWETVPIVSPGVDADPPVTEEPEIVPENLPTPEQLAAAEDLVGAMKEATVWETQTQNAEVQPQNQGEVVNTPLDPLARTDKQEYEEEAKEDEKDIIERILLKLENKQTLTNRERRTLKHVEAEKKEGMKSAFTKRSATAPRSHRVTFTVAENEAIHIKRRSNPKLEGIFVIKQPVRSIN